MSKTSIINKRARFDYDISESLEAGLVLAGHEVKAIKNGHMSLRGAYVKLEKNEAFLVNAMISPYQPNNIPEEYDSYRPRKLLLHKKELNYLIGKGKERGLTLIPVKVYTRKGKIKLELGIGKGKKKTDKRETIKKREDKRKMDRALREGTA